MQPAAARDRDAQDRAPGSVRCIRRAVGGNAIVDVSALLQAIGADAGKFCLRGARAIRRRIPDPAVSVAGLGSRRRPLWAIPTKDPLDNMGIQDDFI